MDYVTEILPLFSPDIAEVLSDVYKSSDLQTYFCYSSKKILRFLVKCHSMCGLDHLAERKALRSNINI